MTGLTDSAERRRIIAGALLMVCATFCFTALDSVLKLLASRHDVLFLVFARNALQLLFVSALIPVFGARAMLPRQMPFMHALRGALLVATTILVVLSLRVLPMAQTYAISFSAPLIAVLLARLFLGERITFARFMLILLGFSGVLVALQPNAPGAGLHLLLPLGMALANAIFHVVTRAIAGHEKPMALVFSAGAAATAFSALALPWHWAVMDAADWGLMIAGGAAGTMAHVCLTQAYRMAPTGVVAPMIYTQIISACMMGYLVFGEAPALSTLIGSAIVAGSGVALVWLRR